MTDTTSKETAAAPEELNIPDPLSSRTTDSKRLLHAARALSVLEQDLRALLGTGGPQAVDSAAVAFGVTAYRGLRDQLIGQLTDADQLGAQDPVLGLPEVPEDTSSFSVLLLGVSQATRWVLVEETFPNAVVQARINARQLEIHAASVGATVSAAAPAPQATLPTGTVGGGTGYI